MSNEIRLRVFVQDQATGKMKEVKASIDGLSKSKGLDTIKSGFGMGIGAGIAMQATAQITSALRGLAGDIIGGAMAMEQVTAKLDASFKSTGTTLAANQRLVDQLSESYAKLGFVDDDVYASLAILQIATKDVGESQVMLAAASDLARLKGISLEEASQALVKVEAGQYRMLKSLGIVLRDGATAQEALAAVQKAAGGQAAAYASTTAGAAAAVAAAWDEVTEGIGMALLPVIKTLAQFLSGTVIPVIRTFTDDSRRMTPILIAVGVAIATAVIPALKGIGLAAAGALGPVGLLTAGVATLATVFSPSLADFNAKMFADMRDQFLSTAEGVGHLRDALADPTYRKVHADFVAFIEADSGAMEKLGLAAPEVTSAIEEMKPGFQGIRDWAKKAGDTIRDMAQISIDSMRKERTELAKLAKGMVSDVFDPQINAAELLVAADEVAAAQRKANAKGLTKEQKHEADLQLLQAQQHYADLLAASTQYGTEAERVSAMAGQLQSASFLAALSSNDPLIADSARRTAKAYADSIVSYLRDVARKAIKDALDLIKKLFETHSPPGPEAALHGIDKWGRSTAKSFTSGMTEGLKPAGMKGAIVGAASSMGSGGSSGPQVIQLVVDGRVLAEVTNAWNRSHSPVPTPRPA